MLIAQVTMEIEIITKVGNFYISSSLIRYIGSAFLGHRGCVKKLKQLLE